LIAYGLMSAAAFAQDNGFGDPTEGQAVFQDKGCVRCHAVRGAGGRIGPDLGRKVVQGSFFEIAAGMWNHSPAMREKMEEFHVNRATFEGDELSDLTAFLYFLKYFDEPGDPRVGKTLFSEKHCIQCHEVEREGGGPGPRLDALPRSASPLRIARDLWNHGAGMVTAMQMQGLVVPSFEGEEIIDLMAYLRSQGVRTTTREFQSPGDPDAGQRLFDSKGCSRCHAIFGARMMGPDLGREELRGSVTQIAGRMWNHWSDMAEGMKSLGMARPQFEEDELADLFAYIFIARYQGEAGDVRSGESIYREKGCATCHRPDGTGEVGPPLADITTGAAKEDIMQRMWNHGPAMWDEMAEGRVSWPRFEASELRDLLSFLISAWAGESQTAEEGGTSR